MKRERVNQVKDAYDVHTNKGVFILFYSLQTWFLGITFE